MADKGKKSKDKKQTKNNKKINKSNKPIKTTSSQPQDRLRVAKVKPKPAHLNLSKEGADFKQIVRIASRDVPGYMTIAQGTQLIYGIGQRVSKVIENEFKKEIDREIKMVGNLTDKDVEKLEIVISEFYKNTPNWLLNRPKLREGDKAHHTMADLKLSERKDLQRLGKIKSYRGLRLQWGLPVRGQKTRSTFRRSGVVGVVKKK
jgi:small subunit ribosomal protein S13